MALELSSFQWLILAFIVFYEVNGIEDNGLDIGIEKRLNSTAFDCALKINETSWNMECDSNNFKSIKFSTKFFTSKLHGVLNTGKSLIFNDILNTTSFNYSSLYLCDSEWRYFIIKDQSLLSSNCIQIKNVKKLIYVLNETSVIKIEISHSKKSQFIFNSLSKYFRLNEVLISENSISTMSFLSIHSNNTIKILSLKSNSIQEIAEGLFSKLSNLENLDLSHNLLKSINKSLFNGLTHLVQLDLSHNNIEYISEDSFNDLVALESILLNNNILQSIHENVFKLNSFLLIIDISNNDFKTIPSTLFQNMPHLKNVSCSNCNLSYLDNGIFQNSSYLAWFVFPQNNIQNIHPDMFKDLNFLEVLDLKSNNISHLNVSLFSNHPYLTYVNISDNKISDLNLGVFIGARNIRYLDLSFNRITSDLTYDYLKNYSDIEYLGLHHNMITAVDLGRYREVRVRVIDISYNLITKLQVQWKQLKLIEKFNLNNNFLTTIALPPCIPNMKQTLTFTFQYNRISTINMNALLFDERRVKTDRTMTCFFNGLARNYVDLTNNPLRCDCKMYPFYKYIRKKSPRRFEIEVFVDKGNITCEEPNFLRNNALISLSDDILSCPLNDDKCPQSCYCGIRGKDNVIFVNCSSNYLQEVPQTHPCNTTVLYFNRNLLKSMSSLDKNIWCELTELHLDYNLLSNLDNWKFPVSLRYLSVRGNKLKTLSYPLMNFISDQNDFELYFGNNDFNCDCDSKLLKAFLRQNINFIKDNDKILCNLTNNNNTYELLPLTTVFDSVLCSQEDSSLKQRRLVIILCVFFSVLIAALFIYYRQRQLLLSYFYVHCRPIYDIFYADAVDDEAIFDAFVAYSSNDRAIVLKLLEELENNPPFFQLLIHERNWLPGRFITDNIADSVENSRRTIIILSNTFLASPWFNVELRAAMCKMAQDAINRIIVILTDKSVSFDSIDPELRYIVSKRTYLEWGERWFWEKLRYALPRKSIKEAKLDNEIRDGTSELSLIPSKNVDENI